MVALNPAPDTLGLASPALGPWFRDGSATTPTLPPPNGTLSVNVSLPQNMEWRAPASGTAAYAIATDPRPAFLASLRQANGNPAFANGNLVVLFTLLPEVELRLSAISNILPSPDNNPVPAGGAGRPPLRHLALEIPASAAGDIDAVERLRADNLPAALSGADERAAYLGLTAGGGLGNAAQPIAELHRPAKTNAVILKNRTASQLDVLMWAFDDRGRALDPGAVANWLAFLASGGTQWDNLWAHTDAADQRTATVNASRTLLFCTASEGPLPDAFRSRLTLQGLTAVAGDLYTVGASPSVQISAAGNPNSDTMPVPRLALLPNGNYAAAGAPGTALFAGWVSAGWPAAITRDFARIAVTDIESLLVGANRTDESQATPTLRLNALRNTATTPFLSTTDAAAASLMTALNTGAAAIAMSPVMDTDWGPLAAPSLGTGTAPDTLTFTVHALRGEGTPDGGTVADQRIAVRFPAGSLPANAWIRLWPHGLDPTTGLRFRQDGGAGRADASGRAFVVMSIPDGTAAPADPSADPVRLSFDALVTTTADARYYVEQRYARPSLTTGSREPLPTLPGNLPGGQTAWICEAGAALARGSNQLGSGQTLLAIPSDEEAGTYALVDRTTLDDSDVAAATLRNAVGSGDRLVVTVPAFASTPEGDVIDATGVIGASGAAVLRRTRNLLAPINTFGQPVPTMERREVAAIDPAGATGAVATTPGRASSHEAPPSQLAHPGVPASAEIHGTGVAVAGPLAAALTPIMRERAAANLSAFITLAQAPITTPADPGGTSTFGAILETLTHGITGDASVRAFLAAREPHGGFMPGQSWTSLKSQIESAIPLDLDTLIDTSTFDDDTLAASLDRAIVKTRDGAAEAARAIQAAIARAEDLIYLETPAIDALTAGSGTIALVSAIVTRLGERSGLTVVLCVPEKFLPGQAKKLEAIRKAGVNSALKALTDAAPDNVVLFTPSAGSGRALHMSSTTVIVDDVILITGSTHLWRRGLTIDISLSF